MSEFESIPELAAIHHPRRLIRIPNQIDVPVTDRVMAIVDSAPFQRLKKISQLGLVASVYPAANHSRFEHSLGVYRMALLFLQHFVSEPRFLNHVDARQAEAFILAALLHDIGHWPFCHPIEDMKLDGIPNHEQYAEQYIGQTEIAACIQRDWICDVTDVLSLIDGKQRGSKNSLIESLLSGPIDVDKMDYLYRDSLHAGVPYGQNFDSGRLIGSLCVNQAGDRLAITEKGRTAAELMVFARYVMFSEVYWHHAVRSATAMLQRAFFMLHQQSVMADYQKWFQMGDAEFVQTWLNSGDGSSGRFLEMLFGDRRRLYKRVAQFSCVESPEIFRPIAHRPYPELVQAAARMANIISTNHSIQLSASDILIDAPPVGLEVQFNVDVYYRRQQKFQKLSDVSPVVNTLATRQFDDYVKQVRVFVHPDRRDACQGIDFENVLLESIRKI